MMYLYYCSNKIFVERTSCFFRGVASKGRLKFFSFMFGQAEHVHMLCLVGSINYYC